MKDEITTSHNIRAPPQFQFNYPNLLNQRNFINNNSLNQANVEMPSNIRSDSLDPMEIDMPNNKRQKLFNSYSNKSNYCGSTNGFPNLKVEKDQGCLTSTMNNKHSNSNLNSISNKNEDRNDNMNYIDSVNNIDKIDSIIKSK